MRLLRVLRRQFQFPVKFVPLDSVVGQVAFTRILSSFFSKGFQYGFSLSVYREFFPEHLFPLEAVSDVPFLCPSSKRFFCILFQLPGALNVEV